MKNANKRDQKKHKFNIYTRKIPHSIPIERQGIS